MKAFFFDTETTWLKDYDQIVQFWWIFWNYNPETNVFIEERRINQYLNVHAEISPKAYETHHLSKEFLSDYWYIDEYIWEILSYFELADIIIWHNVNFDRNKLVNECKRIGEPFNIDDYYWIDTMIPTTKLVGARKRDWSLKWPKLTELYYFLFHKDFEDAHNAMWDVLATKDCFIELQRRYNFFDLPVNLWWSEWKQEKLIDIDKKEEKTEIKKEDKIETKEKSKEEVVVKKKWIVENDEIVNEDWIIYRWRTNNWLPDWIGKLFSAKNNLMYEGNFKDWRINWEWKSYYKNWNIRYEWSFKKWNFEGSGKLYYSNWDLKYEWSFKKWQYSWKWKYYEKNELIYEWGFVEGLYQWKGKEYNKWILRYKWDFIFGLYDWKGIEYSSNGKKIYEWWFYNWNYDWEGILYDEKGKVKHEWNFKNWNIMDYYETEDEIYDADDELLYDWIVNDKNLSIKELKRKYPTYPEDFLKYYKEILDNNDDILKYCESIEDIRNDSMWDYEEDKEEDDNKKVEYNLGKPVHSDIDNYREEKSLEERIQEFDDYEYDDEEKNEIIKENKEKEELEDNKDSEYVDPIYWIPESLKKKKIVKRKEVKAHEKKEKPKKEKIKKEIKSSIKEEEKRNGFFDKKENIYAVAFIIGVAIIITIIEIILL